MASVSPADLDDWVPAAPPKASRPAASVAPADLDDWVPAAKPKEEERPGIIAGTAKAGLAGLISGTQDVGETLGKPATERKREYYEDPITAGDLLSPSTFFPKLTYGLAKSYPMLAGGVLGGIGGTAVGGAPGGLIGGTLGAMGGSALQALGPNLAQAAKETSSPDEAFDLAWKRTGIETAVSGASWALFGGIAPFKNAVKKEFASFIGPETPAAEAARTAAANKTMGTLGAAGSRDLAIQALGVQPAVSEAGRVASNVSENRPALQGVGENYVADVAGAAVPAIGHAVAERGYHMLRGAPKPAADATTPPPGAPPADGESSQTPGADAIQAVLRANQLESAAHNDKSLTPEQRQAALDEARGLREKHSFPGAKKTPPAAAPTGEEPAPEPPAPPAPAAAEPAPAPPAPAAAETPASAPITKVGDGIVGGETLFGWQRISQSDAFDPDAGIALGTVTKEERAQLAAAGLLNERGNLTYSGLQDLFAERDRRAATGQRKEATLTPEGEARLAARRDIRQPIGTNGDGHPIYEDENGVRSYGRDGVRVSEPVQMIPTREGYRTSVDRDRRGDEFKTDEERAPAPAGEAGAQQPEITLKPNGDGKFIGVARVDGKVAGQIGYTVVERNGERYLSIDDVWVKDAHQGRGIATAMYEHTLDNLPADVSGVISESSWIKNKNQVPRIHEKLAEKYDVEKSGQETVFRPRKAEPPPEPGKPAAPVKVETPADMAKVRARTDPDPSAAEVHDGTAEKGRGDFQGIPFAMETPKGATRTDKHNDPPLWSVPNFPADYVEIERTVGADKEPVDAFIGPNPKARTAYIIDQIDPATGKFDEHKVMLGFDTSSDAANTYFNAFPDGSGPSRLGNMSELSVDQLKDWLKNGNTKKAFAPAQEKAPAAPFAPLPSGENAPILAGGEAADHGIQAPVPGGNAGAGAENVHEPAPQREDQRVPAAESDGSEPDAQGVAGPGTEGLGGAGDQPVGTAPGGGDGQGDLDRVPAGAGPGAEGAAGRPDSGVAGRNFTIAPGAVEEGRSPLTKARDNLAAIELAKRLVEADRPATKEEQAVLAKYVGWGGLSGAFRDSTGNFRKGFEEIGARLHAIMTPEEYSAAARSTQYAHYTAENVIRSMWDTVKAMGYRGGTVFEPGMGVGHFLGMMPEDLAAATKYQGIEMDPATATIAKLLYPESGVREADFTRTPLPDNNFDLVIGNPPFGDITVRADPKYAAERFLLHDYFFAKSMDALRPGGLMAFVTSAGTMNKIDPGARRYLAQRGEFVGGVRLPSDAFKQNAGTEVTTDILFFKKRLSPISADMAAREPWTETVLRDFPNPRNNGEIIPTAVSSYFAEHPEQILGREGLLNTQYASARYGVEPIQGHDLTENLRAALDRLPKDVMQERPTQRELAALDFESGQTKDGSFYLKDGVLHQYSGGAGRPVPGRGSGVKGGFTAGDVERVTHLIPLRDALRDVFRHDLAENESEATAAREELNRHYDKFVKKFGPVNKATYQYRRPNIIQQEYARAEARENARARGDLFDEGHFDPDSMRLGATLSEVARARATAREAAVNAGRKFEEGSFDPAEMPDLVIEKRPNIDPFMDDPESYRLRAIEEYDDASGKSAKKAIFRESIVKKPPEPDIKSANDGLLWSLNQFGRLDLDKIAEKMGSDRATVIGDLGDAIYKIPGSTGTYEPRDIYLSGDVKDKLAIARTHAASDPEVRRNVAALEAAQPAPLPPSRISMTLGMPWMPVPHIAEFVRDHLGLGSPRIKHSELMGGWTVTGGREQSGIDAGRAQWSTEAMPAHDILKAALNRTPPKVFVTVYEDRKPKQVFDPVATQAAVDKYIAMKAAFDDWMRADEARGDAMATLYNDRFNRSVLWKPDGSHLTTPGVASDWSWRPHQTRVVARIIQAGNTYMAHAVGAGKTSAMIGAGMEMKRLGLINKPMYVVPNHMLAQFAKEFYEQYPTARITVADERRFHTDRRKQFIANVAQDDLDAVIITHSAFGRIPISDRVLAKLIQEQISLINEAMRDLDKQEDRITVKRLENQKEKLQQKLLGRNTSAKDATNTFEELGADFLFVDEAQAFRKLDIATRQNIKGIASEGSSRAWDLYSKVRYLDDNRPGRSVVFASGTPVVNTMGELYSISRYLQPGELKKRGLAHFDNWASSFGDVETKIEQTATGDYEPVTRFSKFVNTPELYQMVGANMDVVTSPQLEQYVTRPQILDGKRNLNMAPRTLWLDNFQDKLRQRVLDIKARKGPPKKGDDIILSVISDGRRGAIDPRLVDDKMPSDPKSKLNQMIANVHRIWQETKNQQFYDPADQYKSKLGRGPAAQMIFSNEGINPSERSSFSADNWIRRELIRLGVPAPQIAFIKDYPSAVAKQKLFNDVNEGKVRILVGSVQKMGTGVNAQRRLYGLHNVDPLWFPADDVQRLGRALRQGNTNPEVAIHDYTTKGTYDSTMWQTMARKGRFIEQFFEGDPDLREMADLGEASQYEQISAMSTSDDRVIRLTEMKHQLETAERRESAHDREQYNYRHQIKSEQWTIENGAKERAHIASDIAQRQDTRGDAFAMDIGGQKFSKRGEAAPALEAWVAKLVPDMATGATRKIGQIGGFPLALTNVAGTPRFDLLLTGGRKDTLHGDSFAGIIASAEAKLRRLEDEDAYYAGQAETSQAKIEGIKKQVGKKFEGSAEIQKLRADIADLQAQIMAPVAPISNVSDAEVRGFSRPTTLDAEGAMADDRPGTRRDPRVAFQRADEDEPRGQTATPEFKRWFGDSKVLDDNGEPLRVYHGTKGDVEMFDPARASTSSMHATAYLGHFFSAAPEIANSFVPSSVDFGQYPIRSRPKDGGNVIPAFLSIAKPFELPLADFREMVRKGGSEAAQSLREHLESQGFDGIKIPGDPKLLDTFGADEWGADTWIAFHSEQIKSATGNRGTFDANDPRIAFQRADEEHAPPLSPALKRWFGDSKVVDDKGAPLVMYHGTVRWDKDGKSLGDIEVFDREASKRLVGRPESMDTVGSWFSTDPGKDGASMYAGQTGAVYPVLLNIRNPWRPKTFDEFLDKMHTTAGRSVKQTPRGRGSTGELRAWLKAKGFDGIVFPRGEVDGPGQTVWVALEPEQIKSAIGNRGTYDANDPRIAFQRAEEDHAPPFFSALTRAVEASKQQKAHPSQWQGIIDRLPGVKQEEREWSGVREWLAEQKGPVTKAALLDHIRENEIQVGEVMKGAPAEPPAIAAMRDRLQELSEKSELTAAEDAEHTHLADELSRRPNPWLGADTSTKYHKHTLPGGKDYREMLLTLPASKEAAEAQRIVSEGMRPVTDAQNRLHFALESVYPGGGDASIMDRIGKIKSGETPIETLPNVDLRKAASDFVEKRAAWDRAIAKRDQSAPFRSPHFDEPNVLAHIRMNDRTGPNGEKILHVEEIQSDWHQKGRKEGYKSGEPSRQRNYASFGAERGMSPAEIESTWRTDDPRFREWQAEQDAASDAGMREARAVPNAPFKTAWHELALKRALRYAAEHGYDKVTWTTGEQQAERYDLRKHIDSIGYQKRGDLTNITIWRKDGQAPLTNQSADHAWLENNLGKEMAQKIIDGEGEPQHGSPGLLYLEGLDLKVGGEGMKGFYDKILPAAANKIGKPFGAKVGETKISTEKARVPSGRTAEDLIAQRPDGRWIVDRPGYRSGSYLHRAEALRRAEEVLPTIEPKRGKMQTAAVHSIDITPEMRRHALEQGFPMLQRGEAAAGSGGERITRGLAAERPTTDSWQQGEREIAAGVEALRDKMAPGARLEALRNMRATADTGKEGKVHAAYYRDANLADVVAYALGGPHPDASALHEFVHYFRRAGLLDDKEWSALTAAAEKEGWLTPKLAKRYSMLDRDVQLEEAIAERFPQWLQERADKSKSGFMASLPEVFQRLFYKMDLFRRRVADLARRVLGKDATADDVFTRMETGQVGRRDATGIARNEAFARASREESEAMFSRERDEGENQPPARRVGIIARGSNHITDMLHSAADRALDWGREIQMLVTPMAHGERQADAKDFANAMRLARWDGRWVDNWLKKNFTPEQRTRMFNAAEEESQALQDKRPTEGIGLDRLSGIERDVVEALQARATKAFDQARDLGMHKSPGLPSYVPHMLVQMVDDIAQRMKKKPPSGSPLDPIGRNLSTTTDQLRHRKYKTIEEAEAAARAGGAEGATVVRDIRSLALSTSHLNEAIAGKKLINAIERAGKAAGVETVSIGGIPEGEPTKQWFTIPQHPAFMKYGIKEFVHDPETGGLTPKTDADGKIIFERKPIYVRAEYEGPLRAVLTVPNGKIYNHLMDLKAKTMGLIMYSPLIHNAVEWGRALPAMPGKVLTFRAYFDGNRARNDPETMKRFIAAGLSPIADRGGYQDITSMVNEPNIAPGRSWTAQVLAAVPGLFDPRAGEAVKRGIDKAGDFWHNTLLWDRVADLQMGLAVNMSDHFVKKGLDQQTADRLAAHLANRYAGALPKEAMSNSAQKIANLLAFSRTFTLGNLGAMKDMIVGLPKDVQAQILRDRGLTALDAVQSIAKRKAIATVMLDIGLMYVGNAVLQSAIAVLSGDKTLDEETQGYVRRYQRLLQRGKENPLALLNPFEDLTTLSPLGDNEPNKKDRVRVGAAADGTAVYMRNPVGKIGEEFVGWLTGPLDMVRRKLSTIARPAFQVAANSDSFGHQIYDPYATTPQQWMSNIGKIAMLFIGDQVPLQGIQAARDALAGRGDPNVNAAQVFGPLAGMTFSKGFPGGPATAEKNRIEEQQKYREHEAMPAIRRKIQDGDIDGARKDMADLHMEGWKQKFYLDVTLHPRAHISPKKWQELGRMASPEEFEDLQRMYQQGQH